MISVYKTDHCWCPKITKINQESKKQHGNDTASDKDAKERETWSLFTCLTSNLHTILLMFLVNILLSARKLPLQMKKKKVLLDIISYSTLPTNPPPHTHPSPCRARDSEKQTHLFLDDCYVSQLCVCMRAHACWLTVSMQKHRAGRDLIMLGCAWSPPKECQH